MLKKVMNVWKTSKGMTMLELIIAVFVLATFATAMMSTVMAGQKASESADAVAFFDNKNQNAVAAFKMNPQVSVLANQKPFDTMKRETTADGSTFTQYYSKRLEPLDPDTEMDKAAYRSVYKIVKSDVGASGFDFTNVDITLEMENHKKTATTSVRSRSASDGWELMKSSVASGKSSLHTTVIDSEESDPDAPDVPEVPGDDGFSYITFKTTGAVFNKTGTSTITKLVANGTRLGDMIELGDGTSERVLPDETTDMTVTDSNTEFSGWVKDGTGSTVGLDTVINTDTIIRGDFVMPTPPDTSFQIRFEITGGTFNENGSTVLVRDVPLGTTYGDFIQIATGELKRLLPEDTEITASDSAAVFGGWKYQDGSTVNLTDVVDGSKTIQGAYAIVRDSLTIEFDLKDGPIYWAPSKVEMTFEEDGGYLYLVLRHTGLTTNTPFDPTPVRFKGGKVSDYVAGIDVDSRLKVHLNVNNWNYSNAGLYLERNPGKRIYYNGGYSAALEAKFMHGEAWGLYYATDIQDALGQSLGLRNPPVIEVTNISYHDVTMVPKKINSGFYTAILNTKFVEPKYKTDEVYRVKLTENGLQDVVTGPPAGAGSAAPTEKMMTYKLEILNSKDENIVHPDAANGKPFFSYSHWTYSSNLYFGFGKEKVDSVELQFLAERGAGEWEIKLKPDPDSDIRIDAIHAIYGPSTNGTKDPGGSGAFIRLDGGGINHNMLGDSLVTSYWFKEIKDYPAPIYYWMHYGLIQNGNLTQINTNSTGEIGEPYLPPGFTIK